MKNLLKFKIRFAIIISLFTIGITTTFAQVKSADTARTTVKAKSRPYVADPNRVYTINLTEIELRGIFQTGPTGILPFIKTTDTPANQIDNVSKYYNAIYQKVSDQYSEQWKADREKFVNDSLKTIIKLTKKP